MAKTGRPSKFSLETQNALCLAIRTTKCSLTDAADSLGLDRSTLFRWMKEGEKSHGGPKRDFFIAVRKARADGSQMLLARIAAAGKETKHWQANAAVLQMTEPQYAPKVHVAVREQLEGAISRLAHEFRNEPEVLRRALAALATETTE